MKAILTLDNGFKFPMELIPTKEINTNNPKQLEKDIVKNFNLSQPNMVHKVVKCHLMRN